MSKVMFAVPPIKSEVGIPTSSQNRQYQFFKDPFFAYPVIPAIFISMILSEPGHEVIWVDSVAEGLNDIEFEQIIIQMKPDYIIFEANTMLISRYYEVIEGIKNSIPSIKIILCGEHATACPEEVKEKSKADIIIHGGKWYYQGFKEITSKEWPSDKILPHINREVSRWWLYAYKNGNFKYTPATYMMASQDCWYRPSRGACTFCTWVDYHPENVVRPVDDYFNEIEGLVTTGFREFFDDSGTFPVGKWLKEFCDRMTRKDYEINNQAVSLSEVIAWGCNMRFGALQPEDFKMMEKAGCRFILWGFESANQSTLDRLQKGSNLSDIKRDLIVSNMAGIWNHLTVMMGYWWETLEEERLTYNMVKWLLLKDICSSMQATIFMPYPGTKSFEQAKSDGVILTEDWAKWTMLDPILKLKYPFKEALKLQSDYYKISYHPKFLFNKLKRIKTWDDFKFYGRLSKKVINRFGGLVDYGKEDIN